MKNPFKNLLCAAMLAFAGAVAAAAPADAQTPNPQGAPDQFVLDAANAALTALKAEPAVKSGDPAHINQIVDQYIMPYVDFEKTTRLSAGKYWRQASDAQKTALAQAFRGTLMRTYSGALSKADQSTTITVAPLRGAAFTDDGIVKSTISQSNTQPIAVDYRLEKTPQGWRIYDLNVEGIWLIENYRNQFSQQIEQSGIDGLIAALQAKNN